MMPNAGNVSPASRLRFLSFGGEAVIMFVSALLLADAVQ